MPLFPFLQLVSARESLSVGQAREAMEFILEGRATTPQIAALLMALRTKGETVSELLGFAQAMRARVERVDCGLEGGPLVDTCGTGGSLGPATFNISTVAAFVIAGAGVRVAKHGNRSMTSLCGSADVLEALGVNLQLTSAQMAASIRETGIGFLFAPALHPAMKHAQRARAELKVRTVFNLLGPLTNPAGARSQLIGAPSIEAAELMAGALAGLGTDHAFIVHGLDGLDEVSTTSATAVFEVQGAEVARHQWEPEDFGISRADAAALAGGDPGFNRDIALAVLEGEQGARRDIVLVNAAAALVAAGRSVDLRQAMAVSRESIDSGVARAKLASLARFSQRSLAEAQLL